MLGFGPIGAFSVGQAGKAVVTFDPNNPNCAMGTGTLALTGLIQTSSAGASPSVGIGQILFSGFGPSTSSSVNSTLGVGNLTFTGVKQTSSAGSNSVIGVGSVSFVGLNPTVYSDVNTGIGAGTLSFTTTFQLSISSSTDSVIGTDAIIFTGKAFDVEISSNITVSLGIGQFIFTSQPLDSSMYKPKPLVNILH